MNTKQKLTLGIAAIFMITLAIVGVTYAYFVTRVNYSGTATATVKTANITVTYGDGNGEVTLVNVEPGAVTYKGFTVKNTSDIEVPFAVLLTSTVDMADGIVVNPEFVHTIDAVSKDTVGVPSVTEKRANSNTDLLNATLIDECYDSSALENLLGVNNTENPTTKPNCYDGNRYNNIYATLYKIEWTDTLDNFNALDETTLKNTAEGENATKVQEEVNAPANISLNEASSPKVYFGADLQRIDAKDDSGAPAYNYYILKIEYKDIHKNQNVENEAVAKFKVDITGSTGEISNE